MIALKIKNHLAGGFFVPVDRKYMLNDVLSRWFLQAADKQKPSTRKRRGFLEFNLDDDLLSHGETPHYHRRYI
ncbi:hypothetical protein N7T98_13000, partial [Pseudomonas syringae pv. tomato]|uniref:hypothetical protein n=1 Tax=Pseudomonas syringae group genomosp. 3 TaxID=251701 RepID=UPI0022A6D16E